MTSATLINGTGRPETSAHDRSRAGEPAGVRWFLRDRTMPLHAAAEAAFDLDAMLSSRESYTARLRSLAAFYMGWASCLEARAVELPDGLPDGSRHIRRLEQDLAVLRSHGFPDIPQARWPMPQVNGAAALMGAIYVIEGSALGGKVIARAASGRLGVDGHNGGSFFAGDGADTGRNWQTVCQVLERVCRTGAARYRALAGAEATFRRFVCAMNMQAGAPR